MNNVEVLPDGGIYIKKLVNPQLEELKKEVEEGAPSSGITGEQADNKIAAALTDYYDSATVEQKLAGKTSTTVVGDLTDLTTTEKSTLVGAINEAATKGGSSSVSVVDNLTTEDATKALSAKQGVVLKGMIDAKVGISSGSESEETDSLEEALEDRITTLEGKATTDEANITSVTAKATTNASNITTLQSKVTALENVGATKVEQSSTNGNIKINGVEKTVYTLPTPKTDLSSADSLSDSDIPSAKATATELAGLAQNISSVSSKADATSSDVSTIKTALETATSESEVAADVALVKSDLDDIDYYFRGTSSEAKDLSTLTHTNKLPYASGWNHSSDTHCVIKIDDYSKIVINGNSTTRSQYTFLTDYDVSKIDSATIPSYASGYTALVSITLGDTVTFDSSNIPTDAHYLLIALSFNSVDITPNSVTLYKDGRVLPTEVTKNTNDIAKLNEQVETNLVTKIHDIFSNYISADSWIAGKYINASGVETKDPNAKLYATDKIYLKPNTSYYYGSLYSGYYAYYDEDDNVLESHGANDAVPNPFTTPSNISYARFTATNQSEAEGAWIGLDDLQPKDYTLLFDGNDIDAVNSGKPCEYEGDDVCVFNKCLCIGDSMTYGTFNDKDGAYHPTSTSTEEIEHFSKYAYPRIFTKLTGVETENKSVGGYTSIQWYEQFSKESLDGYDIAIIQLGINDGLTLGGWTAESKTAFTNIINKVKNENNNIKIFVATIIPAYSYQYDSLYEVSQGIRDLVTEMADENVILIDIAKYGHTLDSKAYNCGHLSAYGYYRLAKDYKAYISYYMCMHKNLFRQVQFIGTDISFL